MKAILINSYYYITCTFFFKSDFVNLYWINFVFFQRFFYDWEYLRIFKNIFSFIVSYLLIITYFLFSLGFINLQSEFLRDFVFFDLIKTIGIYIYIILYNLSNIKLQVFFQLFVILYNLYKFNILPLELYVNIPFFSG